MTGTRRSAFVDQGFTLIELLVVMIIIGILTAIAIPVTIAQRQKAVESSLKSDLRTVAEFEESYAHDGQDYLAVAKTQTPDIAGKVSLSPGNSVEVTLNGASTAYCIVVSNPKTPKAWVFVSTQGGQQTAGVQVCPTSF
ncbi:type II secretion system GspH family protein [Kineococcus sp. NBC_00420]|uniref:type IV pilin protein n=1 Tax=Kineococcus sp. NBC_00420 TaxID=2903564 RepID=UPI002E225DCC